MIRLLSLRALTLFALAGALFMGTAAHAQNADPTDLGVFGAWKTFTYQAEGGVVCYALATPAKSESNRQVKRDAVHFMITDAPGRRVKGQPSTIIGYKFKADSVIKLKIDDKSFDLYPVDDTAWVDKPETEKAIIAAMKGGKKMTVSGVSARGTKTTDTYSLEGISAALDKVKSACE